MRKKIILSALAVLILSGLSFAQWGVGVKLGGGTTNDSVISNIKESAAIMPTSYDYTDNSAFAFGLEGFYEKAGVFNLEEQHAFGIRLGYNGRGTEEIKVPLFSEKFESTYSEIPLTVYYKFSPETTKFAFIGGVGAAYGFAKLSYTTSVNKESETASKLFPFLVAGTEYRFSKLFALGAEVKYNISAKMKKDGEIFRDVSGPEATLTARFYF